MNFPTLFYGFSQPKHMTNKFSYQKIEKWELMHKDNDFSTHIKNIFFKVVKIIIHQISSLAWVYIWKGKLQGKKLTTKDVCNPTNLERLIISPLGFHSLRSIHTSLDYLEHTKKNIFAMIRQLGPPTSFVTLKSAEHLWVPLCNALRLTPSTIGYNENLEDKDLDFEIRRNPVLCSHYFNHRIKAFQRWC